MTDALSVQKAHRDYLESRILAAHPVEIIYLLYRVAMDNLNAAIAHLKNGDHFARAAAVTKAEMAIDELVLALDHSVDAPFTRTLADLYHYTLQQIVNGHAHQSEQAFREALSILTILSEAWSEIKAQVSAEAAQAGAGSAPLQTAIEDPAPPAENSDPGAAYRWGPQTPPLSRDWSV
jgi:flagellar protein FliS